MRRVYTVTVPIAGQEQGFPVAQSDNPEVVAELVRMLLRARKESPDRITVMVEDRVEAAPPF